MTIALLLSNPGRGSGSENIAVEKVEGKSSQNKGLPRKSNAPCKKGGGTLIICPMTLLGQWKVTLWTGDYQYSWVVSFLSTNCIFYVQTEIETHSKEGALSVYAHYGAGRAKDSQTLLSYDVVITTYGILSSDYQNVSIYCFASLSLRFCSSLQTDVYITANGFIHAFQGDGPLQSIQWFRVVLDEAHTIKASKCQSAQAAFNLSADTRWCLTGTPIQVFRVLSMLVVVNCCIQRPKWDHANLFRTSWKMHSVCYISSG